MCRSSDLSRLAAVEDGGMMSVETSSGSAHGEGLRTVFVVSVPCNDQPPAQEVEQQSTVCRQRKNLRSNLRCPLRIVWTAALGIFCTIVTYLCLPDSCVETNQNLPTKQQRYQGRFVHKYGHVVKRSSESISEGFWEKLMSHDQLARYCNTPEIIHSGAEGDGISEKYTLTRVHLLLSPGQRSLESSPAGISNVRYSCLLENKARDFPEVWNFMHESISYKSNQHNKGAFKSFEIYPWGAICQPGQLLPDGVHQSIIAGNFLKKRYETKFEEFGSGGENSVKIHVSSYPEELLFHNIMAFTHGFLKPSEFQKVQIHKTPENFCNSKILKNCRCQNVETLKPFVNQAVQYGHFMFKPGFYSANQIAGKVGQGVAASGSILEISRSLLLQVCQKVEFTCGDGGNCLDSGLVSQLLHEGSNYWKNLTRDTVFKTYSKLLAYPFLRGLSDHHGSSTETQPGVFLFSADAAFSTHVLSALEFKTMGLPSYASRLVFESYIQKDHPSQLKHHFRVLHDGIDITDDLPFCKGKLVDGLCNFEFLNRHLSSYILSGKKDYVEACIS